MYSPLVQGLGMLWGSLMVIYHLSHNLSDLCLTSDIHINSFFLLHSLPEWDFFLSGSVKAEGTNHMSRSPGLESVPSHLKLFPFLLILSSCCGSLFHGLSSICSLISFWDRQLCSLTSRARKFMVKLSIGEERKSRQEGLKTKILKQWTCKSYFYKRTALHHEGKVVDIPNNPCMRFCWGLATTWKVRLISVGRI